MEILQYITEKMLILIPVLNILGLVLKKIEKIPDKYIPLLLLLFGVLGAFGIGGLTVDAAIQGVLITGVAVYGNQVVKQLQKDE
ncbi:MAG: phage holin family protein [Clostridia bacterium]|nr:phage holin family protein [Clostridia bacterium]